MADPVDYCAEMKSLLPTAKSPEWAPAPYPAVAVPRCEVVFKAWGGSLAEDTHNKKSSTINVANRLTYAELEVLRSFHDSKWSGRWVDPWARKLWIAKNNHQELSPKAASLLSRIRANNGGRLRGCWDLFLWKERQGLFVEVKRPEIGDVVKPEQWGWLKATVATDPHVAFLIVEWSLVSGSRSR